MNRSAKLFRNGLGYCKNSLLLTTKQMVLLMKQLA